MKTKALVRTVLLVVLLWGAVSAGAPPAAQEEDLYEQAKQDAMGICPPINLLDKDGNMIDPVDAINAEAPYSPRMTCGKCHDYDKITRGYHFQQGKGEKMSAEFQARYPQCSSPGQYGGRW
ncbi:MAG: hypothetical protein JRI36_12100 [Deltaproteobacteria bacterium]|nr:hypothetical protein [Deltaproteobacteria bacterium]